MNLSVDFKLRLYREMLRIRLFEERICELYSQQQMRCPVHLSIGQESPPVGMCAALRREDLIFGTHRSHGHFLAKGGSMKSLLSEIYGKATGCCQGIGGSMHLVDLDAGLVAATPIVGSSIPVALGAALANSMRKTDIVTVLFLGDAAVEEGVFHETINFASVKKLPLIFFCENNFYSVYTHLKVRQPDRRLETLVRGHAVPAYSVDGNEILEVYSVAEHAVKHVRQGHGPLFIEAITYRYREHCGVNFDNDIGYRTQAEYQEWLEKCPIKRFKNVLLAEKVLTEETKRKIHNEVVHEIDEAVQFAKESPFLAKQKLVEYEYA